MSQKFIGLAILVLRGRVFGAEGVYINVIKTKCICHWCSMVLIFYEWMFMLRKKLVLFGIQHFVGFWLSADMNIRVIILDSMVRCLLRF